MCPKKGRRVRKIEIPTDTPTELKLGDTTANIHRRRGRQQKGRKTHRNRGGSQEGGNYILSRGVADKCARTDRSDTEW